MAARRAAPSTAAAWGSKLRFCVPGQHFQAGSIVFGFHHFIEDILDFGFGPFFVFGGLYPEVEGSIAVGAGRQGPGYFLTDVNQDKKCRD